MTPSPAVVAEIVQLIWSTQLGLEPAPAPAGNGEALGERKDAMTGVVQISGGFVGALHLSCARELVVAAAARMFSRPEADIPTDDLRDALGELTNMTAGNLKSRLPGSNSISMPTVVDGTDYEITRLDSEVMAQVQLLLNEQPMVVTLFQNRD